MNYIYVEGFPDYDSAPIARGPYNLDIQEQAEAAKKQFCELYEFCVHVRYQRTEKPA